MKKFTAIAVFLPIFTAFAVISCAQARSPKIDQGKSAMEGQDLTCPIEACGNQLVPGYTYCRKTEGGSTNEALYFVGPITNCDRPSCVEFKVFYTDGRPAWGDTIPKRRNRVAVPWSRLVQRTTFELGDRGFWPVLCTVYWKDKDGHERSSVSEGEIRLRVIARDYLPLHEVEGDSNFVWDFRALGGERVKMTTGLRTYISRRK